jgi:hypothetical protein
MCLWVCVAVYGVCLRGVVCLLCFAGRWSCVRGHSTRSSCVVFTLYVVLCVVFVIVCGVVYVVKGM